MEKPRLEPLDAFDWVLPPSVKRRRSPSWSLESTHIGGTRKLPLVLLINARRIGALVRKGCLTPACLVGACTPQLAGARDHQRALRDTGGGLAGVVRTQRPSAVVSGRNPPELVVLKDAHPSGPNWSAFAT
jgi:hypothetical protein